MFLWEICMNLTNIESMRHKSLLDETGTKYRNNRETIFREFAMRTTLLHLNNVFFLIFKKSAHVIAMANYFMLKRDYFTDIQRGHQ